MYGIILDSLIYQLPYIVIKRTYSLIFFSFIEKAVQRGNYLTIIRAFRVLRPLRAINKVPSKYMQEFLIDLILVDQWFNSFSAHKVYLLLRENSS